MSRPIPTFPHHISNAGSHLPAPLIMACRATAHTRQDARAAPAVADRNTLALIAATPPSEQGALLAACRDVVSQALQCCVQPGPDSAECVTRLLGESVTLDGIAATLTALAQRLDAMTAQLPVSAAARPDRLFSHDMHPVNRVLGSLLAASGNTRRTQLRLRPDTLSHDLQTLIDFASRPHPSQPCSNIDSLLTAFLQLAGHAREMALSRLAPLAPHVRNGIDLYRIINGTHENSLAQLMTHPHLLNTFFSSVVLLARVDDGALPQALSGLGQRLADAIADALPGQLTRMLMPDAHASRHLMSTTARTIANALQHGHVMATLLPWRDHDGLRRLVISVGTDVQRILSEMDQGADLDHLPVNIQNSDGLWLSVPLDQALRTPPPSRPLRPVMPGASRWRSPTESRRFDCMIETSEALLRQLEQRDQFNPPAAPLDLSTHPRKGVEREAPHAPGQPARNVPWRNPRARVADSGTANVTTGNTDFVFFHRPG